MSTLEFLESGSFGIHRVVAGQEVSDRVVTLRVSGDGMLFAGRFTDDGDLGVGNNSSRLISDKACDCADVGLSARGY